MSENSLTRVLNAIAWKLHDANEARVNGWMSPPTLGVPRSLDGTSDIFHSPASASGMNAGSSVMGTEGSEAGDATSGPGSVGYVQGMNVMAAPFLYVARSEVEAFAAFDRYITNECPGYVRGSMEGVHKGLALVDQILHIIDPKLAAHLHSKGMKAEIYAFPSVLTLCACTPPLPEVLRLWDFLFAYGSHLNLLCIVSQLILMRDQLMSSPRSVVPCTRFCNLANRVVVQNPILSLSKHSKSLILPSAWRARYQKMCTNRCSFMRSDEVWRRRKGYVQRSYASSTGVIY